MAKIFLWCARTVSPSAIDSGVMGYALADDGTALAGHFSSDENFSKHDMGFTSDWKHENYRKHYPGGFELEWVDDPDNNEAFKAAFALYKQQQMAERNSNE